MNNEMNFAVWYRYKLPDQQKLAEFRYKLHAEIFIRCCMIRKELSVIPIYHFGKEQNKNANQNK